MIESTGRDDGLHRYGPARPLTLLTDYAPDAGGGGAVILRSLLGPDERDRMVWMSPTPPSDPTAAGPGSITLGAGRGRRSIGMDSTLHAGKLAREAIRVAEDRGARAFWVVLHNAAVAIAARLIRWGKLPVHVTVHDDPAFANALRSKRYIALVPWIERDFARAIRGAASVDVIGSAMADRYRRRYGVDSVVVHRAVAGPIAPVGDYDARRLGLRVGVLGSTYAYEQLPILARAVEFAASLLKVAPRILVVGRSHGERLRDEFAGRVDVEVTGHVDEPAGVALLRDCFALYLNYPFGRRDAVLRRTSFPTKLSTYIHAARPLILHTPADGSVAPIAGPDGYATLWSNLDPDLGAHLLTSAWMRPDAFRSRHVDAERVRLAYYDPARNRRTLFAALNALVPDGGAS